MRTSFDIIVVGAGHAGVEAAWASSKLGANTALVTIEESAIARMSCNPAIGGLGKGQIVREIDALGGLMGLASDDGCVHFRMLNRRKGPAVWAPRAQADRQLYPNAVRQLLSQSTNLRIIEGLVEKILVAPQRIDGCHSANPPQRVTGVLLRDGRKLTAQAIVLATGTFMNGLMHCGEKKTVGGRIGEKAAIGISQNLRTLGFSLLRLKTGTPPRVDRDTVDYGRIERQDGDDNPRPFSFMNTDLPQTQIPCWITYTNEPAHELIRQNLHRAPLYSGQINSTGPRYCPSIEDKVVRFSDKPRHQVFLEPEGYDSSWIYCNGIPTSLPKDIQEAMVACIVGLENAKIVQYGYAIEYDFVPANQTLPTLETRLVDGLYLAGQVNGTSGYEEAAGQGLVAGVNAANKLLGRPPLLLQRDQAYIGVLIDDIITKVPTEPYRMFTSRAEYRLALRSDNADMRLTQIGRTYGLVDDVRWEKFNAKKAQIADLQERVRTINCGDRTLANCLKRPDADIPFLQSFLSTHDQQRYSHEAMEQVLIDARYSGYLVRQDRQIARFRKMESLGIPPYFDYTGLHGVRNEAREKLSTIRPDTLGQASRIAGISPADILALWVHITRPKPIS